MSGRDYQKSRVYAWENKVIAPLCKDNLNVDNMQPIVDYVWNDMGLNYPPKVVALPRHCTTKWATGERLKIQVQERGCPTWVLLHELAHSLTSDFEGNNHAHNEVFMGMYLKLIYKYIPNTNPLIINASLKEFNIKH